MGAKKFANATKDNVGRPLAIILDNEILSSPVIREPILTGSGQISGGFTVEEANQLAILLRAGALPAPMKIIEERTVGADLGKDSIRSGIISLLAIRYFETINLLTVKAVKNEVINPTHSVTAKPFTGPLPK